MYDLDKVINRRSTGSLKWDIKENELPMWVADMDFPAAPCIREAIEKRAVHGIFGYATESDKWKAAYATWWRERHGLELPEWGVVFATGVIPVLSSSVRAFSRPNENVVVLSPVYNMFFNSIFNNGRRVLESRLLYEDGTYRIDFEDLEKKLSDPQTSMMFLCNPHNPTGNIWSREELSEIGHMAAVNDVIIISDEIHCDITDPGYEYVPFASVSEEAADISITAVAPTKAFNIAGIQSAACFSHNKSLSHRIWRQLNTDECGEGNVFSEPVAIAAFEEGGPWLDEVRAYIAGNKALLTEMISEKAPCLRVVESHSTYLAWVDISGALGNEYADSREFSAALRSETGLFVSGGYLYRGDGDHFIRINLAAPKAICEDGIGRLCSFVKGD